ncbi:uncharacterized protein METZ01_LOCUS327262, partial [marine metagenome]
VNGKPFRGFESHSFRHFLGVFWENCVKIIDMHVHMVGNEASSNGCWVRVSTGKIPLYAIMLRALGLPAASIYKENFDEIYRTRLLECIRESTVDAVCLLAQEAVYHDNGTIRKEAGNAFAPNDYV